MVCILHTATYPPTEVLKNYTAKHFKHRREGADENTPWTPTQITLATSKELHQKVDAYVIQSIGRVVPLDLYGSACKLLDKGSSVFFLQTDSSIAGSGFYYKRTQKSFVMKTNPVFVFMDSKIRNMVLIDETVGVAILPRMEDVVTKS